MYSFSAHHDSRIPQAQVTAGTASAAPRGRRPEYRPKENDPHCLVLLILEASPPRSRLTNLQITQTPAGNQDRRELIHTKMMKVPRAALAMPAAGGDDNTLGIPQGQLD